MDATVGPDRVMTDSDRSISEAFRRERTRLRGFIRRQVSDPADAEDILQEVFYELVEAARLLRPIEQVGAWLFRVARNRITDRFRRRAHEARDSPASLAGGEDAPGDDRSIEGLLPSPEAGPEAAYARRVLLEELAEALDELPDEQREVFIAHEIDGQSFKEIAERSGVGVNTLLSRKRYALLYLRRRLQAIHDEFV
jgi:RNA polymerase sigma factor (sigma-70 family)